MADFLFSLIVIVMSFNVGIFMDGLFLRREDNPVLRLTGWLFFGLLFFVLNLIMNLFREVYYLLKTKKLKNWKKFIKLPDRGKYVGFWWAAFFYLFEIFAGVLAGFSVSPSISTIMESNTLFSIPLLFATFGCFGIFFFNSLGYKQKRLPFVIASYVVVLISSSIMAYLMFK